MAAALAEARGQRGTARAGLVLSLAREPVRSAMETRTRLLVVRAGIPEPDTNVDLVADDGWVAEVDFLWRGARLCADDEGDDHRTDRERWQGDVDRHDLIERAGFKHLRWTSRSIRKHPDRTTARLAAELHDRGLTW